MTRQEYQYDAFISHAVEDKLPIANELCARLERAGLKIWYSGRELRVGDRLTQTIEQGLNKSRFGIVILSPTYVSKMWTLREFYSLLSREKEGKKIVLPVLFDITPEELAQKDLTMAEMFSLRAEKGMDYLVDVLTREIRLLREDDKRKRRFRFFSSFKSSLPIWAALLILCVGYFNPREIQQPENDLFNPDVFRHVSNNHGAIPESRMTTGQVTINQVTTEYSSDKKVASYHRNESYIVTEHGKVKYRKDVEATLQLNLDKVPHTTLQSLFDRMPSTLDSSSDNGRRIKTPVHFLAAEAIRKAYGHSDSDDSVVKQLLTLPARSVKPEGISLQSCEMALHTAIPNLDQGDWLNKIPRP
jgi:hypothetical protein